MNKTVYTKQIPNIITGLNLFSGCISIVFAFKHNFEFAFYFILLAAIFDFFDGFVARLLKVSSNIGKELDSLSDVVSFGVAPSMILFNFFYTIDFEIIGNFSKYIPYIIFIIPVFSAFRLSKFNLDTRQTSSFIGLPAPANALFFSTYVFLPNFLNIIHNPITILILVIIFSILLISEIPMFSLKFKTWNIKDNIAIYLFLIFVFTLIVLLNPLWVGAIAITGYIAMNFGIWIYNCSKGKK